MTIDERLERLTERHEALTQSLELLHHDIGEMRAAAAAAAERDAERAAERAAREAERDAKYNERFSRILDVVETLAATAQNHEHRIERLER